MARALAQMGVLVWKDLLIDLRRKENVLAMFFFALLTLLLFQFALESDQPPAYRVTPRALTLLGRQMPSAPAALGALAGRDFANPGALLDALAALPGNPMSPEQRLLLVDLARQTPQQQAAAGLLWVIFVLAGVLGLNKSFGQEREQGCMEGLLLTPAARGVLYLGKMLGNMAFLVLILLLLLPLWALLLGVRVEGVWASLGTVLLGGVLGFSALGTLLGGVTASLRGKEVLLPLLLFPLLVPLLLVVVHVTQALLAGEAWQAQVAWLQLLLGFDVIFLIVSYLVFDVVMEL